MNSRYSSFSHGSLYVGFTVLVITILMCLLPLTTSFAQPTLNIKRLVNNWPTIELYFSVGCQGQNAYNMSPQDLEVYENGIRVNNTVLSCPDLSVQTRFSIALAFDCSGSMAGTLMTQAINAGLNFVACMDGTQDEACVVSFGSYVDVVQTMTSSKSLLSTAISGLTTDAGTALWDGIYTSLSQLINSGSNTVRAVIVLADGGDNSSVLTTAHIIKLATQNRLRIFAIGLGSGLTLDNLKSLVDSTGGKFYASSSYSSLNQIYQEIETILRQNAQECVITYQASCKDGSTRTVDLTLKDFCGGSDQKSKTFTAPLDTQNYTDLHISLDTVNVKGQKEVTVPINLDTPINGQYLYPSEFTIQIMDPSSGLRFKEIRTPVGSVFEGVPITSTPAGDEIVFNVTQRRQVPNARLLAELTFTVTDQYGPCSSEIRITRWTFQQGCFRPVTGSGYVMNVSAPAVTLSGPTTMCSGDSLVLTAAPGYVSYLWYPNGETTRSITVRQSGQYWVTGSAADGNADTSFPVTVTVLPQINVAVTAQGPTALCSGESVTLEAAAGYALYNWSNGDHTRTTTVQSPGVYTVTVSNGQGCTGTSEPITITIKTSPTPVITPSSATVCDGDSVELDAGDGYASYSWSNGASTRKTFVKSAGTYIVTVISDSGCTGTSTGVAVVVEPRPQRPVITRGGDVLTCSSAASYQWYKDGILLPGETNQTLHVTTNGKYSVEIWDNAHKCSSFSDEIDVVTGIDRVPDGFSLGVYPEPNQGIVTIQMTSPGLHEVDICVIDLLGRIVVSPCSKSFTSELNHKIDIRGLAKGVYLLRVSGKGLNYQKPITRQ